jgi:hypothetical protein
LEGEWHELETKREGTKKQKVQYGEVVGVSFVHASLLAFSTDNILIYGLRREGYTWTTVECTGPFSDTVPRLDSVRALPQIRKRALVVLRHGGSRGSGAGEWAEAVEVVVAVSTGGMYNVELQVLYILY